MALTNPADFLPTPTAILPLDYETLLTQWIDWAFAETKAALPKAA